MSKTQDTLRKLYLEMLMRQLKVETGISSRTNMYMVEVQLMKDLVSVFTGCDTEDEDQFHDYICNMIDELHHKFDC